MGNPNTPTPILSPTVTSYNGHKICIWAKTWIHFPARQSRGNLYSFRARYVVRISLLRLKPFPAGWKAISHNWWNYVLDWYAGTVPADEISTNNVPRPYSPAMSFVFSPSQGMYYGWSWNQRKFVIVFDQSFLTKFLLLTEGFFPSILNDPWSYKFQQCLTAITTGNVLGSGD